MNSLKNNSESVLQRAKKYALLSSLDSEDRSVEDLRLANSELVSANNDLIQRISRLESEISVERNKTELLRKELVRQKERLHRQTERVEKFKLAYNNIRESTEYRIAKRLGAPIRKVNRLRKDNFVVLSRVGLQEQKSSSLSDISKPTTTEDAPSDTYASARQLFQREGKINEPLRLLEFSDQPLSPEDLNLKNQILGLQRLLQNPPLIPPAQGNSNYLPKRGSILYCAHSTGRYNSNGYAMRTAGLTGALAGFAEITVVARPGYPWDAKTDRNSPKPIRRSEQIDGVKHVFNPGPNLREQPLDMYLAYAADVIAREATLARAELIHAASNHITALPALIAARRLGIPFVYEVRGLWEITEAATNPSWMNSERYELAKLLETIVATNADHVLSITDHVSVELVKRGVVPARVTTLPNAADEYRFAPLPKNAELIREYGIGSDDIVVGYAGSLVEYEGIELLVEAFNKAVRVQPKLRLLIIGSGPSEQDVIRVVHNSEFSDRILVLGRISAPDVPKHLNIMDIVACPRLANVITEMVSPLKPLEAFSAGKAVVASSVGPLVDLCGSHEERGLLFIPGDSDSLAEALVRLAKDEKLRSRIGRSARSWLSENRTWPIVAKTLNKVHCSVKSQHRELNVRPISTMRIALISDEFTRRSFEGVCELVFPTPDNWKNLLSESDVDALVVESAWEGNNAEWHRKIGFYDEELFADIRELVSWCRSQEIPTIFWNKEDPVHFNRFIKTASIFDHIFTTDAGKIPEYFQKMVGKKFTVSSLPFWAHPGLHNPLPTGRKHSQTVAYGGTYYGDRYAERSKVLATLLRASTAEGLSIYDRQANIKDSPYSYPTALQPYVHGGLSYEEMLNAYRSHPIHINVNSVIDSPTMFSRRVVELAACGTPVLSGPGNGVDVVFDGLVPTTDSFGEATSVINFWMNNEKERISDGWNLHRHVYRAHLAGNRISLMLRTAGLEVDTPTLPPYKLSVSYLDGELVNAITRQTHLPAVVEVKDGCVVDQEHRKILAELGIRTLPVYLASPALRKISFGNSEPDPNMAEDLCRAAMFTEGQVVFDPRDHVASGGTLYHWVEGTGDTIDLDAPRVISEDSYETNPKVLAVRRDYVTKKRLDVDNYASSQTTRVVMRPTILFAGHDLKFALPVLQYLKETGNEVLIDKWDDHNRHDEARSLELLGQADIVFCEWALGNLAWYSRNKQQDQRLIARFHSQELFTPYLKQTHLSQIDQIIFVGEFVRRVAVDRYQLNKAKTSVVPNVIGVRIRDSSIDPQRRFTLGMVGIVPKQKRIDRALDVMEALLEREPRFTLEVKGRLPEDFHWMKNRPVEMRYYNEQFERINSSESLRNAVRFVEHGDDMETWYSNIGHALSLSEFESFHLTAADGAAGGAIPHILSWPGARQIYPSAWVVDDLDEICTNILSLAGRPADFVRIASHAREQVRTMFNNEQTLKALADIILDRNRR